VKWLSKTIRLLVGIILIGSLLTIAIFSIRLSIFGEADHTTSSTLGMRFNAGAVAVFFLFLCYLVY